MRVLLLGGSGRIGAPLARLLAARDEITGITIAGRDGELARQVAASLGAKASARVLDATDEAAVTSAAREVDLVVNTAGPDFVTAQPAARAAIASGRHYVDLDADDRAAAAVLALDDAARAAGVIVLGGAGHVPGLSNLLAAHAAASLDVVEQIECGATWAITRELLAAIGDAAAMRASGRVNASWQQILRWATPPVRAWRGGRLVELVPAEHLRTVELAGGEVVEVFPIASTEPVTLPRRFPAVREVTSLFGVSPTPMNRLLLDVAARGLPDDVAALAFLDGAAGLLDGSEGHAHRLWATAVGQRAGRPTRVTCAPRGAWASTVSALAAATLAIARGAIAQRGVLAPEDCFDPLPFFADVARLGGHAHEEPLVEVSYR